MFARSRLLGDVAVWKSSTVLRDRCFQGASGRLHFNDSATSRPSGVRCRGGSLVFDHEAVFVRRSPGISNCHMLCVFFHQAPYRLYRFVLGLTPNDNGFQIMRAD